MKGEAVYSLYAVNLMIVVMLAGIEPRISVLRGRFPTLRRKHQISPVGLVGQTGRRR